MSYPEPRYLGDVGVVNASFRPAHTSADVSSASGQTHYLATHASTGGEFGLYRFDMAPMAPGPSTHFHRSISESFFLLSGQVRFFDGTRWITAGPGDFLYVPAGGLHALQERLRRAGLHAAAVLPGRATRGVLRADRGDGTPGRGGAPGLPRLARHLLRRALTTGLERRPGCRRHRASLTRSRMSAAAEQVWRSPNNDALAKAPATDGRPRPRPRCT